MTTHICEAKFSNNSYGFRPNRSVEHAISRTYSLLQRAHLHYVLEFDIKGFFDNVNHSKLIKQLWTMGIQDKQLLFVIKRILVCHMKVPKEQGGQERYSNLVLLHRRYQPLLTDQDAAALKSICKQLTVTRKQLTEINNLRTAAKLAAI